MDLFGDLPAAKNNTKNDNQSSGTGAAPDESVLFGGLPPASASSSSAGTLARAGTTTTATSTTTSGRGADPLFDTTAKSTTTTTTTAATTTTSKSLVSALGVAGTSFAFVPAAIAQARKRKKLSQQQQQQQQQKQPQQTKNAKLKREGSGPTEITESMSDVPNSFSLGSTTNQTIIDDTTKSTTTSTKMDTKIKNEIQKQSPLDNENDRNIHSNDHNNNNNEEEEEPTLQNEESPQLTALHASVTPQNAYNPHHPNDYLAYRERKKTEQIRKDLQREALERLERQEKLRKKIEEERRRIVESGDLDKIVESRVVADPPPTTGAGGVGMGRGRGRGRGVNNLPAWLIQKQQEAKNNANKEVGGEAEGKSSTVAGSDEVGQFDDSAN